MVFSKKQLHFIIATLVVILPLFSFANPSVDSINDSKNSIPSNKTELHESKEGKDIKSEIKEFIDHHLKDSYDFTIFGNKNDKGEQEHVGFSLPVILWDNGLKVFSSSKFHHGEETAEVNGNFYRVHHAKIYKVDKKDDADIIVYYVSTRDSAKIITQ